MHHIQIYKKYGWDNHRFANSISAENWLRVVIEINLGKRYSPSATKQDPKRRIPEISGTSVDTTGCHVVRV